MTPSSSGPVFPGLAKFLELIRSLYARPGVRERMENSEILGDQPLPLIWLVRGSAPAGFVAALAERLSDAAPPQVPHALIDASQAAEQARRRWNPPGSDGSVGVPTRAMPILPLLDELVSELSQKSFAESRLSRFDRYRLVDMLTGQQLEPPHGRYDRAGIVAVLHAWARGDHPNQQAAGNDNAVRAMDVAPDIWTRMVVWAIKTLGRVIDSRWLYGRVPRIGRERRWLMGQPYMVPRHSVDFLGFAERLTVGRRHRENLHQLKKLLVHAFLEDIRSGYHRFRWRILPRPAGWRRTAYVVVLLENATEENGGWELLQLINEVRNETGQLDPLLVIAETDGRPAVDGQTGPLVELSEVENAIRAWRNRLPTRRQKLADNARHLFIRLPHPVEGAEAAALSTADRDAWDIYSPFQPKRPPWFVRRRMVTAMALVAVLMAGWLPAVTSWQHFRADCAVSGIPADWWPATISVTPMNVPGGGVQCLGYSDSTHFLFGSDEPSRLSETQRMVFEENEKAKQLHEQRPDRPLVSLIYFSALTHRDGAVDSDNAVAEELEGMLLWQRASNTSSNNNRPLLRVIVANGGQDMRRAREVVRDFLLPLVEKDPTIVGVVGLDRTITETEDAISELGLRGGIPAVGTTLTGTTLTSLSPLFFQMVPDNTVQAALVKAYVQKRLNAKEMFLYFPQNRSEDSYIKTLVAEFTKGSDGGNGAGEPGGLRVWKKGWGSSPNELDVECGEEKIAFYAGRDDNFKDFLLAVASDCSKQMPHIIANDAVSRFVATREHGELFDVANIPVDYVALGSLVVLAGQSCLKSGIPNVASGGGQELDAFCTGYRDLRALLKEAVGKQHWPGSSWPGERIGVAYDATGLFIQAVSELQVVPEIRGSAKRVKVVTPHRAALAQKFREKIFPGATGAIDFRANRDGRNRLIAILTIKDLSDENDAPICAFMGPLPQPNDQTRDPETGCPRVPGTS